MRSFQDKETEKIYDQEFSKQFPYSIQKIALRKMIMIDNAATFADLSIPSANKLEAFVGDRKGKFGILINDRDRICFLFKDDDFYEVEICDY